MAFSKSTVAGGVQAMISSQRIYVTQFVKVSPPPPKLLLGTLCHRLQERVFGIRRQLVHELTI